MLLQNVILGHHEKRYGFLSTNLDAKSHSEMKKLRTMKYRGVLCQIRSKDVCENINQLTATAHIKNNSATLRLYCLGMANFIYRYFNIADMSGKNKKLHKRLDKNEHN